MVLKDDAFSSITTAVRQGRIIFSNIRRFVVYLLSCNLSEVMVVGLAALFNQPLPLLPMQILFLNLVTDVFPALALGMGEGDHGVMRQSPRPRREAILTAAHWWAIFAYGGLITLSVLGLFFTGLYWFRWPQQEVVTMTFMTIAFAQLWHVFNMRSRGSGWLFNDVMGNPYVWAALVLCSVLILAYLVSPLLARVLELRHLSLEQWGWVLGVSVLPYVLGQLYLLVARRRQ
jgi:Ca2+-transporting ATPase